MDQRSEYAKAGVDYTKMEPFKQAMIEVGKKTLAFPNRRGVYVSEDVLHAHGAVFEYRGNLPHIWCHTQEDSGNKNWIAEWMYQYAPKRAYADQRGNEEARLPAKALAKAGINAEGEFDLGESYYRGIGIDTVLMVVNDVIAQGAMPVVFTDQVEVGDSSWFDDKKRAEDFASGFLKICEEVGMALPAGESATLKYLIKSQEPVKIAPTLSGSVTGIVAPRGRLITGKNLKPEDHIIGVTSSGLHANGVSLVIKRALELPDQFLTKLPNGKTIGEEALIPTRSYVALVEALLEADVRISALLPGTGDGVGKVAFDKRPFSYHIHSWPDVPILFQFFRELGVSLMDCLKTFNWGVGYYVFVPTAEVDRVISIGRKAGYELMDIGIVEEGERRVLFEPENIVLQPPGE